METIPVGDVFYVPSGQTPCHSDHTHQQTITDLITNGNSELMRWYMFFSHLTSHVIFMYVSYTKYACKYKVSAVH